MMTSPRWRLTLALLTSATLGLIGVVRAPDLDWNFRVDPVPHGSDAPRFETLFDHQSTQGTAHAPAILTGRDGVSIVWFDGPAEAHPAVEVMVANGARQAEGWHFGPPRALLTSHDMAAVSEPRQLIVTLGNTIQFGDNPNRVLATIVSLGGWAAASVADVRVSETGAPTHVRKLSLSPFLDRSHLVRAPTIAYADNTIAVPAYFEMGNGFGELVRLDRSGRVRDKARISQGHRAIQPMVVVLDQTSAVALLRNFEGSGKLLASWTGDGGQTWSPPLALDIANPGAPVAAILLSDGDLLMAYNPSATDASVLALARSGDKGRTWNQVTTVEHGDGDARYPAMARLPDGDILLTYSYGSKAGIRAKILNEAWLATQ